MTTTKTKPRLTASRPSKAAPAAALVKDAATARIGLNVSPEMHRKLRVMAAEQGTTITAIVLDALEAHMKRGK